MDLLVERAARLIPVEAKASTTPKPAMASGIRVIRRDFGTKAAEGYVVHAGALRLPVSPGVTALPFVAL